MWVCYDINTDLILNTVVLFYKYTKILQNPTHVDESIGTAPPYQKQDCYNLVVYNIVTTLTSLCLLSTLVTSMCLYSGT